MGVQPRGGSVTTTEDEAFDPLAAVREQGRVRIRLEKRRYGKTMTILEGFEAHHDVKDLARRLKHTLGTGGSAKGGSIELQGDHAQRVADLLRAEGWSPNM